MTQYGGSPTVGGSVSAAGMLLVIAIITGLLASTWRLSPLAPLLAGLALLAVGLAPSSPICRWSRGCSETCRSPSELQATLS